MKVWVTKRALTQGVKVWEGNTNECGLFVRESGWGYDRYRSKGEWWPSRALLAKSNPDEGSKP